MNGDLRKSVKHHITGQNEGVVSLHILKLCLSCIVNLLKEMRTQNEKK